MRRSRPFRWLVAFSSVGLLLASSARWVLAQSAQALQIPQRNSTPPLPPAQQLSWDSIAVQFREAFRVAVNEWIGRARIQGGTVSGAAAILTPGSVTSDVNIELRMEQILAAWRVPGDISTAGSRVLAGAWNDWASGFQMRIPAAYPSFAAVPGPAAPPTRAAVSPPLSSGSSPGEASLQAALLAGRLNASLRAYAPAAAGAPDQSVLKLASWVQQSFQQWKNAVTLTGLIGRGSVPTYAPPYVPVGPVLSGDNVSAMSPFVGPRFGIVVP